MFMESWVWCMGPYSDFDHETQHIAVKFVSMLLRDNQIYIAARRELKSKLIPILSSIIMNHGLWLWDSNHCSSPSAKKPKTNKYQLKLAAMSIHKDLTINSNFYCGFKETYGEHLAQMSRQVERWVNSQQDNASTHTSILLQQFLAAKKSTVSLLSHNLPDFSGSLTFFPRWNFSWNNITFTWRSKSRQNHRWCSAILGSLYTHLRWATLKLKTNQII